MILTGFDPNDVETSPDELTLPAALVVVFYRETSRGHDAMAATPAAVTAELSELVLRSRVRIEGGALTVVDSTPTGIRWCDELLAEFSDKTDNGSTAMDLALWTSSPLDALDPHREAAIETGVLQSRSTRSFGVLKRTEYTAESTVRDEVLGRVRETAQPGSDPAPRTAALAAILHANGLDEKLGLSADEVARLGEIAQSDRVVASIKDLISEVLIPLIGAVTGAGTAVFGSNG